MTRASHTLHLVVPLSVLTLKVDVTITPGTDTDTTFRNALTTKINQVFGVSSPRQLADHVMYCLPPDSFSGIAYAYLNSWNSVYKNQWCNHLSGLMHEVRTYFVL